MIFFNRLRILLRQKDNLFWIFIFPLLLVTCEFLAFGKISTNTVIDTIELNIVNENEYKLDEMYIKVFTDTKIDENENLFKINYIDKLADAETKLMDNKIDFYLFSKTGKLNLISNENSLNLTITKNVIDQTNYIKEVVSKAYINYNEELAKGNEPNPVDSNKIINSMLKDYNPYNDISNKKDSNPLTVYFYALLSMVCLFSCYFGQLLVDDIRADQSDIGIRVCVAPTKKSKLALNYFLAAFCLCYISNILVTIYLKYILKVPLGSNIGLILLTLFVGCLAGLGIGMLISTIIKGRKNKQGYCTIISLTLCFFAGTMSVDIKYAMDKYVPFLQSINPANLITDSFYSLYYYDNYNKYIFCTIMLGIISFIFVGISILSLRREKYASV